MQISVHKYCWKISPMNVTPYIYIFIYADFERHIYIYKYMHLYSFSTSYITLYSITIYTISLSSLRIQILYFLLKTWKLFSTTPPLIQKIIFLISSWSTFWFFTYIWVRFKKSCTNYNHNLPSDILLRKRKRLLLSDIISIDTNIIVPEKLITPGADYHALYK